MSTNGVIGLRGLKTSGNKLRQPPGGLLKAENCVIPSRDCIEPRRGQPYQMDYSVATTPVYFDADSSDTNTNRARELYQWGDHLLISAKGGSTWRMYARKNFLQSTESAVSLGSIAPPEPTLLRMKFAELAESVFWTTDAGLYVLDIISGTPRKAGFLAPVIGMGDADGLLYTRLSGNPNATGSWYAKNQTVAYRATVARKDANGRIIESGPSGRVVVVNPNDVTVAIGGLVRSANVVTATVSAHKFRVGDKLNLTLTGGDVGNFTTTNNSVTAVTSTTITWAETAANYTNVATVTITSGTKSTQIGVIFGFVTGIVAAGDFVRVYRTDEAAGEAVDPGDEHYLAYERILTSTDISNGYVTITDTTPSSFLGDRLITNANDGDGPVNGFNERPPLVRDLCRWDGRLWGLQTTDRHRLRLRLLGTGSPNGLQSADLVAINTRVFVAGTAFPLTTAYLPTENVERTTYDMGLYLNANATTYGINARQEHDGETGLGEVLFEQNDLASTMADGSGGAINAIYAATSRASAFGDPLAIIKTVTAANTSRTSNVVTVRCTSHGFSAGQVIMLARDSAGSTDANFSLGLKTVASVVDANNFTYAETGSNATLSGGTAYYAYATTYKSDNNKKLLRCSKQGIPEAWPLSFAPDGFPDGAEGYRVKPSADGNTLFVYLKNGAIYTVSGQYPYSVDRFDGTAMLLAPDSLAEHSGRHHALTTQGAVAIGESGVEIIDMDVENELRERLYNLSTVASPELASVFAVSYESDRQYQLWLPYDSNTAKRGYVYHSLVGEWTMWPESRTCGLVWKGGTLGERLVLGDASANRLRVENKVYGSGRWANYVDELQVATAFVGQSSVSTVTVGPMGWTPSAGDVAVIGGTKYRITAATSTTLTVDGTVSVNAFDNITVYKHFTVLLRLLPDSRGHAGIESLFRELQLHFDDYLAYQLSAQYFSERASVSGGPETYVDSSFSFGSTVTDVSLVRLPITEAFQRCASLGIQLTLAEAFSFFKLLGYSLTAEDTSEKTGR